MSASNRVTVIGLAAIMALAPVACGDDAPTQPAKQTTRSSLDSGASRTSVTTKSSSSGESTTTATDSTAPAPKLTVDQSVYISATEVHLDAVSYQRSTGEITLDGSFTNGNPFEKSASDMLSLTPASIDFGSVHAQVRIQAPVTPSGSTTEVHWTAGLDADTPIDLLKGRLIFGGADDNQSILPFDGSAPTTIVPIVDPLVGTTLSNGAVKATVRHSLLRGTYSGLTEGHRRLDLLVDVTGLVEKVGGYRCNYDQLTLRFGDGSSSLGTSPEDGSVFLSVLGAGITKSGWISFDLTTQHGPAKIELATPDAGAEVGSVDITLP